MTLDEAIKEMEDFVGMLDLFHTTKYREAAKLGIEALKHLQWERKYKTLDTANLLPGETKE